MYMGLCGSFSAMGLNMFSRNIGKNTTIWRWNI